MRFSDAAAVVCALAVFGTAVGETWAGGRSGGSRSASGARPAHAHRHHSHTRVFIGGSYFYSPAFYPAPYYYPVPVYVAPAGPPPVYVEQGQDPEMMTWYYCQSARAYYPYVTECAEGWQQVVPDYDPESQPAG